MQNLLNINEKQYEMLKRAYARATKEGQEQFEIQGQPVLTKFAKYWLDAIENQRRATGQRIFNPEIHDITCSNKNCGYQWTSRTAGKPKLCPRCKHQQESIQITPQGGLNEPNKPKETQTTSTR